MTETLIVPNPNDNFAIPDEKAILAAHHRRIRWPHFLCLLLGVWLVVSPSVLNYVSEFAPDANIMRVISERELPSLDTRNWAMAWSDVVSGVLIILFSILSASPTRRYPWAQWANAVVGIWLLFAPLIFWTPLPEAYANSTAVGTFVIALALVVSPMPGMSVKAMMGQPDNPPGWDYSPADWSQRIPIAALSLIGFFISYYMAAYQLGHIDRVWDPFFGDGTMKIITSDVSRAWPVADAGLGAVAYMLEFLMTIMGGKNRWRTMPWMVLGLGVLIVPLGGVSIFFIIIQPIVIGTWCTLCLVAAFAMALMVTYSLDELVATGQFLADAHQKRKPLLRTFWTGDTMDNGERNKSTPRLTPSSAHSRGATFPITLIVATALGIALMFTRLAFDTTGPMANSDHLVGALTVTFSIIAFAEVGRSIRFLNIPLGLWLIVAPWILQGANTTLGMVASVIAGVTLILLSIPRGRIMDAYGTWNRFIV